MDLSNLRGKKRPNSGAQGWAPSAYSTAYPGNGRGGGGEVSSLREKVDAGLKVLLSVLLGITIFFLQAWYRRVDDQVNKVPILEVTQQQMLEAQKQQVQELKDIRALIEWMVRQQQGTARGR